MALLNISVKISNRHNFIIYWLAQKKAVGVEYDTYEEKKYTANCIILKISSKFEI